MIGAPLDPLALFKLKIRTEALDRAIGPDLGAFREARHLGAWADSGTLKTP